MFPLTRDQLWVGPNRRTKSLFREHAREGHEPFFTLFKEDYEGFPSLFKIYMSYEDPTEYNFAMAVFGDWEHWKFLCKSYFFKEHINLWRAELEVRLQSRLYNSLKEDALSSESRSATTSAKYLLDKFLAAKIEKPADGRKKKEVKANVFTPEDLHEDYNRIKGTLN